MILQRTQYWAASKSYSPLLPPNACGSWVGLKLYHPGRGVEPYPSCWVLDHGQPWFFNILLLNGTQMFLRNLMSTVLHRQFVIPTVGRQKPQILKPSKGLGTLLV